MGTVLIKAYFKVRACEDSAGGGQFYVYWLPQQEGGCHWAYCATTELEAGLVI